MTRVNQAVRDYFSELGRKSARKLSKQERIDRARQGGLAKAANKARESHASESENHADGK